MSWLMRIDEMFLHQRGGLFPWIPVFFGTGIGLYFLLLWEPTPALLWAVFSGAMVCVLAARWLGPGLGAPIWAICMVALGFSIAGARAHWVAGPVLDFRYYGPVEGRIVNIDRSASDKTRLTLDRVILLDLAPDETPRRVRISLHGQQGFADIRPGMRVATTAHLSAPRGPVEPGGFDFRRHAWFLKLGAIGYTRIPVLESAPPDGGLWVYRLRRALGGRIQAGLPGDTGALATAVLNGDRSGLGQDVLTALRQSNLAHLLAISGLHMGLLTGFIYSVLRLGLVLLPYLGLRVSPKKLAAMGALIAGFAYLLLSGGNVATERAFIMASVLFGALIFDRKALSLRAVALAAMIVLLMRPEALLSPGFQMSFAATTALVAAFALFRDRGIRFGPAWAAPVVTLFLSSLIAGAATAPFAAAHFNIMSRLGLVANLLSVPLMGLVVIPFGVLSIALMPLGLEAWPLWVMGLGIDWIVGVATWVSGLEFAVGHIPSPSPLVLPIGVFGLLFLLLWQGRARFAGLAPVMACAALWGSDSRPPVLIDDGGGLVGVMTDAGRALSRAKGAGFVARTWLENDGDGSVQPDAAGRWPTPEPAKIRVVMVGDTRLIHASGKRALAEITGCAKGDILITNQRVGAGFDCEVYDITRLAQTGSLALYPKETGPPEIRTSLHQSYRRLWEPSVRQ